MNASVFKVGCGTSVLLYGDSGDPPSAVAARQARVPSPEQLGGVLSPPASIISCGRLCAARAIGALAGAAIDTLALLCCLLLDLSDQQPGRCRTVGPFEIEVDLPQLPSGFVGALAALFVQGFARLGVEGVGEGVISHGPFGRKAVAQAH